MAAPKDALMAKVIDQAIARSRETIEAVALEAPGDSPIERALFVALWACVSCEETEFADLLVAHDADHAVRLKEISRARFGLILRPQAQLEGWRVDFLIDAYHWGYRTQTREGWRSLIVECDGHEFHERTKEQAARDRSRDVEFQSKGFTVFRFTGSQIWADPRGCAEKIVDWAGQGV